MERRIRWKSYVRCGAGEKQEIASNAYLLLLNKVQYECIKLLINKEENIFIVGDDDQSIYGFRGSNPEFLLNFPKIFENTNKIILDTNYRSTNQIISLCNSIISQNKNRFEKNIKGIGKIFKAPILLRCYDSNEEAQVIVKKILKFKNEIKLEEISIIYRTNIQARAIIEALMDNNIEYQIKDKISGIYDHFVAKDIICYLKLSLDKSDNTSFFKIANKPKRYINKIILNESCEKSSALEYIFCHKEIKPWQTEKLNNLIFDLNQIKNKKPYDAIKYIIKNIGYEDYLEEYSAFKKINNKGLIELTEEILESSKGYENISDYLFHIENVNTEFQKNMTENKNSSGVVLTTMHSAKGLEFDAVFVIGCIDGIIPHEKSKSTESIEEERRLFYVALTRAKKILYISILKTKYENISKPSRFLKNLIK